MGDQTSELLQRYAKGDAAAYDKLFERVHEDLRRRARRWSQGPGATLSTTALVHETYLSLAGTHLALTDQQHFFHIAARAMRQVLADAAQRRGAQKRGGGIASVTLNTNHPAPSHSLDVLALDQSLQQLATAEPRLAQVVELHFFAGLDFVEIARLLQRSERTIGRDWRTARAWLQVALDDAGKGGAAHA